MYAVIETGGKQYKVAVGDRLKVEKLAADEGASVKFARLLLVADGGRVTVDSPTKEGAVSATVLGHGRGSRIRVFKMKRRKDYRRTLGHRQSYTEIQITAIGGDETGTKVKAKTATETKAKTKAKSKTETKAKTETKTKTKTKAKTNRHT